MQVFHPTASPFGESKALPGVRHTWARKANAPDVP